VLISNPNCRPVVVLLPRSFSSSWSLERGIASNSPRMVRTKISKLKPKANFSNEAWMRPEGKTAAPPVLHLLCQAFREVPSDSDISRKPMNTQFMDIRSLVYLDSQFLRLLSPYLTIPTTLSKFSFQKLSLIHLTLPELLLLLYLLSMTLPKQIVVIRICLRDIQRSVLTLAFRICPILVPLARYISLTSEISAIVLSFNS